MKKILKILLTDTLALTTLFSSVSAAVPTYNMDLITSPSDEKN